MGEVVIELYSPGDRRWKKVCHSRTGWKFIFQICRVFALCPGPWTNVDKLMKCYELWKWYDKAICHLSFHCKGSTAKQEVSVVVFYIRSPEHWPSFLVFISYWSWKGWLTDWLIDLIILLDNSKQQSFRMKIDTGVVLVCIVKQRRERLSCWLREVLTELATESHFVHQREGTLNQNNYLHQSIAAWNRCGAAENQVCLCLRILGLLGSIYITATTVHQ